MLASARALAALPQGARVLEIGAHPFFFSLLMKKARPDLAWVGTNWTNATEPDPGRHTSYIVHEPSGERVGFDWYVNNIETEPMPFDAGSFDAVTYCEVLEHLCHDPVASLENIHHMLRQGGKLLLTTPNPARAYNLQRVLLRQSMYDPYSGYGPYGRHNREYSAAELEELLVGVGFAVDMQRTIETTHDWLYRLALARLGYGEHHLVVASKVASAPRRFRPRWLYRSYDEGYYARRDAMAAARPAARGSGE
jgi:SAM-dependent methyltransferase